MGENDRNILKTIYKENEWTVQDVPSVTSMEYQGGNKGLQEKYDSMHSQGPSAWFDDGDLERDLIISMESWAGKRILEIGCGEGDLCQMITNEKGWTLGIDYSKKAITTARKRNPGLDFIQWDYRDMIDKYNFPEPFEVIVMQGVLEHLDNPFIELKWIIDNFKPKTVITSSPCFWNTRGIIWHTLDMLGAVMSKTDLHYLTPNDFYDFCNKYGYTLATEHCDLSWANGKKMIEDLTKRIPLALKDGNIPFKQDKLDEFLEWIKFRKQFEEWGAVACYRIDI